MTAVTYYMACSTSTNVIKEVRTSTFSVPSGYEIRSATFSSDAGDSPDVITSFRRPLPGGTFISPSTYFALGEIGLKVEYSGFGNIDPVDGVYELTADGSNSVTITFKKWNNLTNSAIQNAGDSFGICISGAVAQADTPTGKITLDPNGEASLTFTPGPGIKGELDVILRPIGILYKNQARVRLI